MQKYSLDNQDDMMANEYVSVPKYMAARYNNIEQKIIMIHIYLYLWSELPGIKKTPNGHYIYKQYIKSLLIFLNYKFFI